MSCNCCSNLAYISYILLAFLNRAFCCWCVRQRSFAARTNIHTSNIFVLNCFELMLKYIFSYSPSFRFVQLGIMASTWVTNSYPSFSYSVWFIHTWNRTFDNTKQFYGALYMFYWIFHCICVVGWHIQLSLL